MVRGRGKRLTGWLVAATALVAAVVWSLLDPARTPPAPTSFPLADLLGGVDTGSGQGAADHPTDLPTDLPANHGAHPEARTEAWGLTAALTGSDGRRLHLQFALFRLALRPSPEPRRSAWATHRVYRAHLAITDANSGRQYAYERLTRDALGLAGAGIGPAPLRLWVENWSLEITAPPGGRPSLRLRAADEGVDADLILTGEDLALTQADLAPEAGNGLRGYLMPRLTVAGTMTLAGQGITVTGNSWLEHAWGAIPLGAGQLAVARFALRLGDGRDLFCLRTARRDGSGTPIPTCTLVGPDRDQRSFGRHDLTLEPLREWASPRDGSVYPVAWRLKLPGARLDLRLTPLIDAQELDLSLRLWAGGVTVSGDAGGVPVAGVGHVELTGYAARAPKT